MVGCSAVVLIVAIAGYGAAVKYGLFLPKDPQPDGRANVGPCFVSLTKMGGGSVRLSVLNGNGSFTPVQRHGDDFGGITLEVRDIHGNWSRLDPINPYMDVDTPDARDSDWVALSGGDEVSWDLVYLTSGRLKAGDRVRLNWKPIGKVPASFRGYDEAFPSKEIHVELTVGKEPR